MEKQRENFDLTAVKYVSGVLHFTARCTEVVGDDTFEREVQEKVTQEPHPDLTSGLQKLKRYLLEDFGYSNYAIIIKDKQFNARKDQLEYLKKLQKRIEDQVRVTGISLTGKELNRCTIKGTFDGRAINCKAKSFENDDYGADLGDVCFEIENEVFELWANDKVAQQKIMFESEIEKPTGKEAASGEGTDHDED
jgi:hypothetical protein